MERLADIENELNVPYLEKRYHLLGFQSNDDDQGEEQKEEINL